MRNLLLALLAALTLAATPAVRYDASDAERARWTMSDMRTLATALEAYHIDHSSYPVAAGLEEAIPRFQPSYVRVAPARDAWGTAFLYIAAADGSGYTIVAAGSDGAFDESSWDENGDMDDFSGDAVMRNGELTRRWAYR